MLSCWHITAAAFKKGTCSSIFTFVQNFRYQSYSKSLTLLILTLNFTLLSFTLAWSTISHLILTRQYNEFYPFKFYIYQLDFSPYYLDIILNFTLLILTLACLIKVDFYPSYLYIEFYPFNFDFDPSYLDIWFNPSNFDTLLEVEYL